MPSHGIFSELGSCSDSHYLHGFDNVYLKVPLRPFLFGIDTPLCFKKVIEKVKEKRTRIVPKKVLFFTKKVEEEYEVEVEKTKFKTLISPELLEVINEIVKTVTDMGYLEAKALCNVVRCGSYGRTIYECVTWDDIQQQKTESDALMKEEYFSLWPDELISLGEDKYSVQEQGLAAYGSSGIGFITLEFQATIGKAGDMYKYFEDARKIAWKYFEEHYGEIDFIK